MLSGPQGGAMDGLDVQVKAVTLEVLARQLEGAKQAGLACDPAGQGGAVGVVEAEDGQVGEEAAAVVLPGLGGSCGGAIKCRDPEDEAAQQAETVGANFAVPQWPTGLLYFFWAASLQAGSAAAWASSPAEHWSASWPKARWICCSS